MNSLLSKEQNEALAQLNKLVYWRREGKSEEEIATILGYEGSPERMYHRLKYRWGWPDWAIYKEAPKSERRNPQGSGQDPIKLPSATHAKELFEKGIKRLRYALDSTQFLHQWLKDGRYVTEFDVPKEAERFNLVWRREDYRPRQWKRICEKNGQDPSVDEFREPISRLIREGAKQYPHESLVWLISICALTGMSVEDLVNVLHPRPREANVRKIEEKQAALTLAAQQLARGVRGAGIAAGRPPEPVSPDEHDEYWELQLYEERGWPIEELELSPEETARLKNLRLPGSKRKWWNT